MWIIGWIPNNASEWQMGFNSAFKGLRELIFPPIFIYCGTRWRSWLRHCATSRKVAGSIPDGVTGILHWRNPFGPTMALEYTQPLTEMSTRTISWGLRRPVRKADNLTTFMCRMSWNPGSFNFLESSGPVQACNGIALPIFIYSSFYPAYC